MKKITKAVILALAGYGILRVYKARIKSSILSDLGIGEEELPNLEFSETINHRKIWDTINEYDEMTRGCEQVISVGSNPEKNYELTLKDIRDVIDSWGENDKYVYQYFILLGKEKED